jgi:hypothetical protein
MRTLLHLVDADGGHTDERTPELRERRLRATRFLLGRASADVASPLRRIVDASVARACDALLREEIGELSDVLMAAATHLRNEKVLETVAEATMIPETADMFRAYASLIEQLESDENVRRPEASLASTLNALRELVRQVPGASSPRLEAMRDALLGFTETLERIADSDSLSELAGESEGAPSALAELSDATVGLARLVAGARRRLGEELPQNPANLGAELRAVDHLVMHAARAFDETSNRADDAAVDPDTIGAAVETASLALHDHLPMHLAKLATRVLTRITTLPAAGERRARPARQAYRVREAALPAWLPPSRTMGGFYVLRALGSGAVGSVFVARRSEDRNNERAPQFALKVPEYAGSAARTLSEEEFLQLFREEAGALLAVPSHANLAKLVTFDAGARPKPILVMELVEGPTLERLVESGSLDMERALRVLDGIARGLRAMHDVGVGHLDIKPSNVILRDPDGPGPLLEDAVLVDFGLAGRKLRPGCATSNYGAPEVWGLCPDGHVPRPMSADVYAFGCLAYEVLTGKTLFAADSDLAIITAHLQHDGDVANLDALVEMNRELVPLVDTLRGALRQDPRKRMSIEQIHRAITAATPILSRMHWPLPGIALAA